MYAPPVFTCVKRLFGGTGVVGSNLMDCRRDFSSLRLGGKCAHIQRFLTSEENVQDSAREKVF